MSLSLRKYQEDGVKFFLNSKDCLLADDMGLGKTVQVAAAINLLYLERKIGRVLIVVPRSLVYQWRDELKIWAKDIPVRVVGEGGANRKSDFGSPYPLLISTYEQVRSEGAYIQDLPPFSLVVLDEAQRIKNRDSAVSEACAFIPRKTSWALTGTPIENGMQDMSTIANFVLPEIDFYNLTIGGIHKKIKNNFLRRTQSEVLPDLPPLIKNEINLSLRGNQKVAYIEESRRERFSAKSDMGDIFAAITRLKQLCNQFNGESSKLGALLDIIENMHLKDHKVLIFSQYVETLKWLQNSIPIPSWIYSGDMNDKERKLTLEKFKNNEGPSALLMSLRAGGVGLNIQEATHVVMFDRWWNPAVEAQAVARAQRFGRVGTLQLFEFIVKGTIEEKIESILHEKIALFDEAVGGAESVDVQKFQKSDLLRLLYS